MDASNLAWDAEAWQRLADAIKASREARVTTQAELAKKAQVSRATVQKLERGEAARMTSVHAIAQALEWPSSHAEDILAGRTTGKPADTGQREIKFFAVPEELLHHAVTNAMVAATDDLTAAQIRKVTELTMETLKKNGLIE